MCFPFNTSGRLVDRYVDKAALEVAHRGSPAMAKFLEATAPIKCQIQSELFSELPFELLLGGLGFRVLKS